MNHFCCDSILFKFVVDSALKILKLVPLEKWKKVSLIQDIL